MKRSIFCVLFVGGLLCLLPASSYSATHDVSIVDFQFSPPTLTINVGDTVRWTNNGSTTHTSTSGTNCVGDGLWASPFLSPGQSFTHDFTSPGTFPYFCAVDAHCSAFQMKGTITVIAAATMPVPAVQEVFPYQAVPSPVFSTDPAQAKPIGVGAVATGGNTFRVETGLNEFDGPVDVYLAVVGPGISFILTSTGLQPFPAVIAPWLVGVAGLPDVILLPDTPTSILAPGTYTFYMAVTPTGSVDAFYIWVTEFVFPPL